VVGVIDTSTELFRLQDKEMDWFFIAMSGAAAITVLSDVHRLGLKDKGIELFMTCGTMERPGLGIIGAEAAEGWMTDHWYPQAADTAKWPRLAAMLGKAGEYRGWTPEEVPGGYLSSFYSSAVMGEALRLAVEDVGVENLTGRAVRDAFPRIKDLETGVVPVMYYDNGCFMHVTKIERAEDTASGPNWVSTDIWLPPYYYMTD